MCNYNKTQVSPYDPTKLAIYSILFPEDDLISTFGQNFKKTVSFDNNVHFLEEKIIVTYVDFDCGITFYPETPTKISRSNGERNYNSGSSKKPKCIPSNYQHIRSFDKQHISIIFLNPYNVWDMVPLDLKSLNHTNDRYFISNHQYFQLTIHQHRTPSYPSLSSLWTMDSEKKDCASALHSFKEISYRMVKWSKQLPRLKSWVISGNQEQWREFHLLWSTVIVFKFWLFVSVVWFLLFAGATFVFLIIY